MMKGRRSEDPRHYVLLEEIMLSHYESSMTSKGRRGSKSTERRVLADDDNVYQTQTQWRGSAGRFILCERDKVPEVSPLAQITLFLIDLFRPIHTKRKRKFSLMFVIFVFGRFQFYLIFFAFASTFARCE